MLDCVHTCTVRVLLQGLEVKVWCGYEDFVNELAARLPAEHRGVEV